MANPIRTFANRAQYGARQLPRVAWYVGHGVAMRRLAAGARKRGLQSERTSETSRPFPGQQKLFRDLAKLLRQDLANVERGDYPLPDDHDGSIASIIRRSRLFFSDLPQVNKRREENANSEVFTEEYKGKRPRYYLQNFHFQSGGWMTEESAERYDTQVEILFNGSANNMRRQLIPPLMEYAKGQDQRQMKLLDVACGTGRFLDAIKQAMPRLAVTGVDLSEPYSQAARRHTARWSWVDYFVANGEQLPFADESFDMVCSVYLFHELPPKIRPRVFAEMARVLKPGGRMAIMDSLQRGDTEDYDGLLEMFPQNFHEPYYLSYLDTDFEAMAADQGLHTVYSVPVFVSKSMIFDKIP